MQLGYIIGAVGCIALGYGIRIIVADIKSVRKPAEYRIDSTYTPESKRVQKATRPTTIGDRLEAKSPGLPARVREKVQG